MADECPQIRFRREVTCSICLEYFTDPYRVDCGHSFCRACIALCLAESSAEATCPQCRAPIQPQNFEPNRDMATFVEIAKQMNFHSEMETSGKDLCESHQEPLKYFCRTDQVRICLVCDKSESHEAHDTIPVEAAALELKQMIFNCMDHVREQRDKVMDYTLTTKEDHQQLMLKIEEAKDKMVTTFLVLREFLVDAEILVSNELSKVSNEIVRKLEENTIRAAEKLASFNHILHKMEQMCRLPENELLQVKQAGNNLQRWANEVFQKPVAYPPALKWKVWELCDIHNFVENSVKQLRVMFDTGFHLQYQKVLVILDPATAQPNLVLSADCKAVRWDNQSREVPDNPQRFDLWYCVLGCEGFSSGRLYWDVDVGIEGNWAIGVAKESVARKGEIVLSSEKGIYAIGMCGDRYWAFEEVNIAFQWNPLRPTRIRVALDYLGEGVAFSDPNNAAELYEFRENSFCNERLYPFFWLEKEAQLKIHF